MSDEPQVRYIRTRKIQWMRERPSDSDWDFDFPVMPGGFILCEQIRIIRDNKPAGTIWRPIPILS